MSTFHVVIDSEVDGRHRPREIVKVRASDERRARMKALDTVRAGWPSDRVYAGAVIVGIACPVYVKRTPEIPWHNGLVGQPCVGHCGQLVPLDVR